MSILSLLLICFLCASQSTITLSYLMWHLINFKNLVNATSDFAKRNPKAIVCFGSKSPLIKSKSVQLSLSYFLNSIVVILQNTITLLKQYASNTRIWLFPNLHHCPSVKLAIAEHGFSVGFDLVCTPSSKGS